MLCAKTKLKIQQHFLFGLLLACTLLAGPALGFSYSFITLLASCIWIKELTLPSFANPNIRFVVYLGALSVCALLCPLSHVFVIALASNIPLILKPKSLLKPLLTASFPRKLNLEKPEEKWLADEIKRLSAKTHIPVHHIKFYDLLDDTLLTPSTISSLKQALPEYLQPLHLINDDKDFIKALREKMNPFIGASQTFYAGNNLGIGSNLLYHPKIKFSKGAISAILAHEFGHLSLSDALIMQLFIKPVYAIAIALSVVSLSIPGILLGLLAHFTYFAIQRNFESLADLFSTQHTSPDDYIESFRESEKIIEPLQRNSLYEKCQGIYYDWTSNHPEPNARIALIEEVKQELPHSKEDLQLKFKT